MSGTIAVIGTLAGTALGAVGGYLTQRSGYRREANERRASIQRDTYVAWLTHAHGVFARIRAASYEHRTGATTAAELLERLRTIPTEEAQVALEHVRLLASQEVAGAAARIWAHLRREPVALGAERTGDAWAAWSDRYWQLRREFIDVARTEFGLATFDWTVAGVTAERTKPDA